MSTLLRKILAKKSPVRVESVAPKMPDFGPWATHSPSCKNPCCN